MSKALIPSEKYALALNSREFMFEEIASLIGEVSARNLCERYGGTALYIPAKIGEGHDLATLLGLGPARELSAAYGGLELRLPLGPPGTTTKRHKIERLLKSTNMTYAHIAREASTSERWVQEIASRLRKNDQPDMFGE